MTINRVRNSIILLPALALALGGLAGCSGGGSSPTVDPGVVELAPDPDTNFDEVLATQDKPSKGWLSAPWALGLPVDENTTTIALTYVYGDAVCYGPAGFTLEETNSKVIIGAFTQKVDLPEGVTEEDCPDDPVRAWKYGTIELSKPLGSRTLTHVGLDNLYADFAWPSPAAAPSPDDNAGNADDAEVGQGAEPDGGEDQP